MAIFPRIYGELRQSLVPVGPAAEAPAVPLAIPGNADVRHSYRQQDHGQLGRVRCQLAGLRAPHKDCQVSVDV